ncbi:hypothetical protein HPB49_016871 [Dermacentor silvarum]|uniref:Uncharacterized protein n=1 Tax=Dermacentor silvarum TaxID=543639 RepID=A0ACB8E2F9_DERSI|nr:hypothetical protein HPB49_016871 [Dermacentor silvarum]
MTDFRQSFVRSSTRSIDADVYGKDGGCSLNGPASSLSRSSASAEVAQLTTPRGHRRSTTNSFDVQPEQLTQPFCSPFMLQSRIRQTTESRRSIRWPIQQMAGLWPAKISQQEPSLPQPARSNALYGTAGHRAVLLEP